MVIQYMVVNDVAKMTNNQLQYLIICDSILYIRSIPKQSFFYRNMFLMNNILIYVTK